MRKRPVLDPEDDLCKQARPRYVTPFDVRLFNIKQQAPLPTQIVRLPL